MVQKIVLYLKRGPRYNEARYSEVRLYLGPGHITESRWCGALVTWGTLVGHLRVSWGTWTIEFEAHFMLHKATNFGQWGMS